MFTEVIAAASHNGIHLYDLRRGTKLGQGLNTNISSSQGFTLTDTWALALNSTKPTGHVYALNRGDTRAKLVFPFPEPMSAISSACDAKYIIAGATSGRLYVWSTSTGKLLAMWDAHYGAVRTIIESPGVLITGGDDASVHIWLLSQVLQDTPVPIATIADHTMPISALHATCGELISGSARLYTASLDHTCKQWRLSAHTEDGKLIVRAQLLATLVYPDAVLDAVVDGSETRVFVATRACVYQTNMYANNGTAAIGGRAVVSEGHMQYPSSESTVSLALNFDATMLVGGGGGGGLRIWDTASRQCVRTIRKGLENGVAQVSTILASAHLGGPTMSVSVNVATPAHAEREFVPIQKISAVGVAPLQRAVHDTRDVKASDAALAQQVLFRTAMRDSTCDMSAFDEASMVGMGDAAFVGALGNDSSSQSQIAELLTSVDALKAHLGRSRRLNDELYQSAVTEWLASRRAAK